MAALLPEQRRAIIAEARSWIGTPYHHRASAKGIGADCLGLIRGVWRAVYEHEPEAVPEYSQDWAEATGRDTLLLAAKRHLDPVPMKIALPADVALFRLRHRGCAQHIGILGEQNGQPTLIHAWSRQQVAEIPLDKKWRARMVATFSFPPAK